MRALLVALVALALVGLYLLMLRGWRSRQRRQGDLPPPPAPPEAPSPVVLGAVPGLFVGTVFAGDWLDRVAVHGLSDRSSAELVVRRDAVDIAREGAPDLHLPLSVLRSAELGDALAGKVMGREGLLVLTWQLGPRTLQSAFRATDHSQHAHLAATITAALAHPEVSS